MGDDEGIFQVSRRIRGNRKGNGNYHTNYGLSKRFRALSALKPPSLLTITSPIFGYHHILRGHIQHQEGGADIHGGGAVNPINPQP